MEYIYSGITTRPNLATPDESGNLVSGIHYDVAYSEMSDKGIQWCRWEEGEAKLFVCFSNELSSGDKTLLDAIVEANS